MLDRSRSTSSFLVVVAGTLLGLAIWHLGGWVWQRFGWWLVAIPVAILVALNVAHLLKYRLRGREGLDQWPEPHGRYYEEWLRLPEGARDYYEWLAERMGNREPWATWARMDRATRSRGHA